MKTARDIFNEMKIIERPGRGGEFMTTCPMCSHLRKKKRLPCLSVKVDNLGVRWHCHHCTEMSGGRYYEGGSDTRTDWRGRNGTAKPQPRNRRPIGSFYR